MTEALRSPSSTGPLDVVLTAAVAAGVIALAYAGAPASAGIVAGIGIVTWWAVIVGVVTRVWSGRPGRGAVAGGLCLAALAALSAVSMIWAEDAARALTEVVRVATYLGLFVLAVASARRTGLRPWLVGLAIGLSLVGVIALASRVEPSLFGFPERELALELPASAGRLSYPVGYWNALAACMALAIVLLSWLGAASMTRLGRALAAGAVPLATVTIYLASSRGGVLAAAIGVAVLVLASRDRAPVVVSAAVGLGLGAALALFASGLGDLLRGAEVGDAQGQGAQLAVATVACMLVAAALRYALDGREPRPDLSRRAVVGTGLLVLVVAVAAVAVVGPSRLADTIESRSEAAQGAEEGAAGNLLRGGSSYRVDLWESAVDAFASEPLGGVGAGGWGLYWNANNTRNVVVTRAHSLFLETLAELGVAGLALVAGFFAAPILAARRGIPMSTAGGGAAALGMIAAGAASMALDWTWDVPVATAPVVLAAALLGAGATDAGTGRRARPQSAYGLGVATLVFAWAAIWACGIVVLGEAKLDDGRDALAAGSLDGAAAAAQDAGTVQPWSPEPPLLLARIEELRGDPAAARDAAVEAIDHAPGDYRGWLFAARAAAGLGDERTAHSALQRARELSPRPIPVDLVFPQDGG